MLFHHQFEVLVMPARLLFVLRTCALGGRHAICDNMPLEGQERCSSALDGNAALIRVHHANMQQQTE